MVEDPIRQAPWNPPVEAVPSAWILAAKKGCASCRGRLRVPPAGSPFQQGPNVGRYFCGDCWTLEWAGRPDDLADAETRRFVDDEASRIRTKRQSSILFEEGPNRVFLSSRGTYVLEVRSSGDLAPNEIDADGFAFLLKALNEISEKALQKLSVPALDTPGTSS